MITTLTPNPSYDKTLEISSLEQGAVHRVQGTTVEAGGKGINVARALARADIDATAIFPADRADADQMRELLGGLASLSIEVAPSQGPIRTNISCIEADGRTTKLNEPGPDQDGEMLLIAAAEIAAGSTWIAGCGSLAPGLGTDFYAVLAETARSIDASIAVDTSGEALRAVAAASPTLLKPNHHELAEAVGAALHTFGDVAEAAAALLDQGVQTVLVSLGADGAVLFDQAGTQLYGASPATEVRNTVGAGDAFLAGYLAATTFEGNDAQTRLREALAWGRAAVASPTTGFAPATDVDRRSVSVADSIDRAREIQDDG